MRNFLRLFFAALSLGMTAVAVVTSLESNLFTEFGRLIREPWMVATLLDFYFNILILSVWVIYKENHILRGTCWVAAFVALGSIATAFYVFLQLMRLKPGDSFSSVLLRR